MNETKENLVDYVATWLSPAAAVPLLKQAGIPLERLPDPGGIDRDTYFCRLFQEAAAHRRVRKFIDVLGGRYPQRRHDLERLASKEYPEEYPASAVDGTRAADSSMTSPPVQQPDPLSVVPESTISNRRRPAWTSWAWTTKIAVVTATLLSVSTPSLLSYFSHGTLWRLTERLLCQDGDTRACWDMAQNLFNSADAADHGLIRDALERACADGQGIADACGALSLARSRGRFGFSLDWVGATKLARKVCRNSSSPSQHACYVYADSLNRHMTPEREEPAKILSLFSNACGERTARSCVDAAMMYLDAKLQKDICPGIDNKECRRNAKRLLEQACKFDNTAGCTQLASLVSSENAEEETVKSYYKKSCEKDDGTACMQLASITVGPEKIKLYEKACNSGEGLACYNAGDQSTNDGDAFTFFEKGCKANNGDACGNAGVRLEKGRGTGLPPDAEAAFDRYAKGCRLGHSKSCFNLAACYVDGRGVQQNSALGRDYLHKACYLKNQTACDELRNL